MPVDNNGIGWSDEWTFEKQRLFRKLLQVHFSMAHSAMQKWNCKRYIYFDLHAGCGIHPVYGAGSPIIFVQEAELFIEQHSDFKYQALMIDINCNNTKSLMENLEGYWNATARCDDNRSVLKEYSTDAYMKQFGLVYCDPTKPTDMPFGELAEFSRYWAKADILIALSATQIKRIGHVNGRSSLVEYLAQINKLNWSVREPIDKHQWTFVYGTNGPVLEWRQEEFYSIKSPKGLDILNRLNLSADECSLQKQLALPNL